MSDAQRPIEGNLADSIAMLEQILEVMPQDTHTLQALYSAYMQSGHRDLAFEYLGRLVDVASESDAEAVAFAREELTKFEVERPSEVSAQFARLRAMGGGAASAGAGSPALAAAGAGRGAASQKHEADISEELGLAWRLYEEGQLSQDEYSSVLHDLTEVSSKSLEVPVSVLHVLNDRGFTHMNRVLNHMSTRSGVPCLSLQNFELDEKAATVLPIDIPAHEGVLPFGFFGNDLMIGVLNPFNRTLLGKVEAASGHRCHTYLVRPDEYDVALGRLRGIAAAVS